MGKIKQNQSITSRTDFFYYTFRNILFISLPLVIVCGLILSHLSFHSSAASSGTDRIEFSLSVSCTLSSVVNSDHSAEITSGTYTSDVGKTTIKTLCNDGNGYSIYANGFSNNEEGNNKLINSEYPQYSIDTGLATSGLTSQWAMKLNNIENDPSPTPPVIEQNYNNVYGIVPTFWTKVASRTAGTTDMDEGSSFTTTYAVYASSNQHAGTYVGQVMYLLTHPAYPESLHFMQDVADWKDELTEVNSSLQAIDKRDGKLYWVTKLADGNIWMTQNLDFDIVADTQDPTKMKTLTSEDTDLTDYSLTGAYSQANGYSYDENTGIISWTPASSAKTIYFKGATVTGWQNSNTAPYSASKTDNTNTGHASLGNYYNWTVAIASNNSSTLTSNTINDISQNPQNSICPKGWRLPTISNQPGSIINSTNEFDRLNYLYNNNSNTNITNLISSPLNFVISGRIYSNYSNSTTAYYLSSTIADQTHPYVLLFQNGTIGTSYYMEQSSVYKNNGLSVRCLAR